MSVELFLDNHRISWEHNVERRLQQPRKYAGNPILRGEYPWEEMYLGLGTVLSRQGGGFRMWYTSGAGAIGQHARVCFNYAESDDGYVWRRGMDDAGRHPFGSITRTNILLPTESNLRGPCVLENRHNDDPTERYLLFFDSYPKQRPELADLLRGSRWCFTAISPDGLVWSPPQGRPAVPGKSDTGQSAVWDPQSHRYIAYMRGVRTPHQPFDSPYGESVRVRYVRAAVSRDFLHWSDPVELLRADEADGDPEHQIHQFSVTRRGGQYVALLSMFHIDEYVEMVHGPDGNVLMEEGTCDVQLAVSRDGLNWHRAADRQVFLPLGAPGQWDSRWLTTSSEIVYDGDRMLFYYCGVDLKRQHSPPFPLKIGVAELPRDRFQALRPRRLAQPAVVETKPLYLESDDLSINADASQGRIVVELCDFNGLTIEGFAKEDCQVIESKDGLDLSVRWRGGRIKDAIQSDSLFGHAIRVRFYLHRASLYAATITCKAVF